MKKIVVAAVLFMVAGSVLGQVDLNSRNEDPWYFAGIRVDREPTTTLKVTGGTAFTSGIGSLWLIPQFDIGEYDSLTRSSSASTDIAWRAYSHQYFSVWVLLSPGIDWVNQPVGNYTAYFNGAVGGFVSVHVFELFQPVGIWSTLQDKVAFYAGYRYKSKLSEAGFYPEGSQLGFGIAIRP